MRLSWRDRGGGARSDKAIPLTPSSFRILVATSVGVVIFVTWLSGILGDSRRVALLALSEVAILGIGLVIALRRGYQAEEAARTANEAKSRFLATMSHELRTPLNAILGFSEIMQNQRLGPIGNEKYRSYATDIHISGAHLLQLINDILYLSEIEAGRLVLQDDLFEIRQMVETVVRINRGEIEKAALTLTVDLPNELPLLRADERRTRQVLFNLIGNAIKFTSEGGHIEITARFDPRGGVRIAVADTGIGIPQEYIPRVFEPFMQVDNSLSRQHAGTGLGLPTAEAIMKLHGGALELSSTVGQGTQVVMLFPPERLVRRDQYPTATLSVA
jgi:signal transduction histidine kinase